MSGRIHHFFVEGETEKALIKAIFGIGKVDVFNIWDGDANHYVRRIRTNSHVYVVYDTDTISVKKNLNRFKENFSLLKSSSKKITLLQQTHNLEDELCRACSCGRQKLYKKFDAQGVGAFKRNLISEGRLLHKLDGLCIQRHKLWDADLIEALAEYEKFKGGHEAVTKFLKR